MTFFSLSMAKSGNPRRRHETLDTLSDHILRDIGLTRGDIDNFK